MLKDQNPGEQQRSAWDDMRLDDKHTHLLLDHGHRPRRFGGDIEAISDQSEEYCNELHEADHADGTSKFGPRMPLYIPHEHLPHRLVMQDVGSDLRLTSDGDAWELWYSILDYLTGRKVAVILNEEGPPILLMKMIGDYHDPDTIPTLVGKQWAAEGGREDYSVDVSVPLYHQDGAFNITAVHIV